VPRARLRSRLASSARPPRSLTAFAIWSERPIAFLHVPAILLLQASKGVVTRSVSPFVVSFSVGWKINRHAFRRNIAVNNNIDSGGRFLSAIQ
jgi:hypothetical protein